MGSQAPPPPNASYPPGPPQQRGQPPMPGSYNLPPVVGRSLSSLTGPLNLGAPMMSQHPNPMSQPQPQHQQVDDRIYMQQRVSGTVLIYLSRVSVNLGLCMVTCVIFILVDSVAPVLYDIYSVL